MEIERERLPVQESELRASLERYLAELEAHRTSVGQPAPWPEFEILRAIAESGGELVVIDPPPPPPPTDEEIYRKKIRDIDNARELNMRAGGVFWAGKFWHTDEAFQLRIVGRLAAWTNGILAPDATAPVRAMDNSIVELSHAEHIQLGARLLAFVEEVWRASWTEKDALARPADAVAIGK